jgi:hypothetical protein
MFPRDVQRDAFLAEVISQARSIAGILGGKNVGTPIGRNQCDASQIEILLFWRKATMPSDYVQKASLSAFYADLEEVVEWETAVVEEIHVLLHAVS